MIPSILGCHVKMSCRAKRCQTGACNLLHVHEAARICSGCTHCQCVDREAASILTFYNTTRRTNASYIHHKADIIAVKDTKIFSGPHEKKAAQRPRGPSIIAGKWQSWWWQGGKVKSLKANYTRNLSLVQVTGRS